MDQLRVTAAYTVRESDLTKGAKLQIMNFLENEATDAQVMALLLDGKIQTLDEMAEDIVFDRFDAALLEGRIGHALKKAKTLAKRDIKRFGRRMKTRYADFKDKNPHGADWIIKSRKTGKPQSISTNRAGAKYDYEHPKRSRRSIMVSDKKAKKHAAAYQKTIKDMGAGFGSAL